MRIPRRNPRRQSDWRMATLRLNSTDESMWRKDQAWSEDVSAISTRRGRLRSMYRSCFAQSVHSGRMRAGEYARWGNYSPESQDPASRTSREARRANSGWKKPIDSEHTASEEERPGRYWELGEFLRSCSKQPTGSPQHIDLTWIGERRRRKLWPPSLLKHRATKDQGEGNQGAKEFPKVLGA